MSGRERLGESTLCLLSEAAGPSVTLKADAHAILIVSIQPDTTQSREYCFAVTR
jgi:hypothetical protein